MGYDKELTRQILGEIGPLRFNPFVIKVCAGCGKQEKLRYQGGKRQGADHYCRGCYNNRAEVKAAASASIKQCWERPEYREAVTANSIQCSRTPEARERSRQTALIQWQSQEFRDLVVANSARIWEDPELRERMSAFRNSPDFRERMAEINRLRRHDVAAIARNMRRLWDTPEYRQHMSAEMSRVSKGLWSLKEYRDKIVESTRASWRRPEYRELITGHLLQSRLQMPRVSSLQSTLYSLLDDLGVAYYREYSDAPADRECVIGPYMFDCVVPRPGKPTLLIECQGDYWHGLERTVRRETAKSSYIANNFSGSYELKYLWEHEFLNPDRVSETVRYWLGLGQPSRLSYDIAELEIRRAPASDYRLLLSKYHYLANAGRGGIAYGAYLADELAAVAIFSPLPRQNIGASLNCCPGEARDLSRLCVNPRYRTGNLLSWFVSRCINLLPSQYHTVVSYCDTTFNHTGAVYRACNFVQDAVVPPDYWYAAESGWVMHKRTLYGYAVRMGVSESDYAARMGYRRVMGGEKLRFVFRRR